MVRFTELEQSPHCLAEYFQRVLDMSHCCRVVVQFGEVARASSPVNHAQDARATFKLHHYPAAVADVY